MRALQVFNQWLEKIGSWGTILFMAVIAVVIPYEVLGRYVFEKMNIWTGEVCTYAMAWASMLGGAVGLKKGYQIGMTSIVDAVPQKLARVLQGTAYAFTLFFFATLAYWGLYQTIYNLRQTSPAMGLVMSVPYAALPTGFFIMFCFTLEAFFGFLGAGAKGDRR